MTSCKLVSQSTAKKGTNANPGQGREPGAAAVATGDRRLQDLGRAGLVRPGRLCGTHGNDCLAPGRVADGPGKDRRLAPEATDAPGRWPQVSNLIATHTIEGEALLANVGGLLGEVGTIVRSCHERYDGLGYPDGLAGEAIPAEARIVACCDAFNAMTADRSYRTALPLNDALDELRAHRGTQFDPQVVDALLDLYATADFIAAAPRRLITIRNGAVAGLPREPPFHRRS